MNEEAENKPIEGQKKEAELPQRPRVSEHVVTEGCSGTHAEIQIAFDPEKILREYLQREHADSQHPQHQVFRELIEARLNHSFVSRRHLTGGGGALQLSQMRELLIGAKTYNKAWRKALPDDDAITALLLYEIRNREEWPTRVNHDTQRDMLQLVSSMATGNDRHSQMILDTLRALPLSEVKEKLFGKRARDCFYALPFTANIAVARQSEDPEWTQDILERVRKDLFNETGIGNEHRFLTGFSRYYRPEVLDHAIALQQARDPAKVDALCETIEPHMKERRNVPDEIFQLWVHNWLPRNPDAGTAMVRHWVSLGEEYIRTQYTAEGAPRLCEALQTYKTRRHQAQVETLERERAQKHAEVDQRVATLRANLPKFTVDTDIASVVIDDSWPTPHLRTIKQCAVISVPGISEKQSLESLHNLCHGLINASWGKDAEGKRQLELLLAQTENNIKGRMVEAWLGHATQIREQALQACRTEGSSTDDLLEAMKNANGLRDWIKHIKDKKQPPAELLPLLEQIDRDLYLHLGNLHRAREDANALERKRGIDAITAEYLQEDIEKKATYLRELYAAGTGLDLKKAEGHAVHADSGGIASVSIGMSMSMRHEMRLEQRMAILHPLDGIYIELGEDPTLEEIKERAAITDWVVPHEVGHLTDWAMGEKTNELVGKQHDNIAQATATFEEADRELAGEMIDMEMKECFIDGLGFWLAKNFGVSDPLKDTDTQRLHAVLDGLCTTMQVFRRIVQERATDREMQIRYGFLVLRFISILRSILGSSNLQNVPELEPKLKEQQDGLTSLFQSLSAGTQCFKDEAVTHVSRLFTESFEEAGQQEGSMNIYRLKHDIPDSKNK